MSITVIKINKKWKFNIFTYYHININIEVHEKGKIIYCKYRRPSALSICGFSICGFNWLFAHLKTANNEGKLFFVY